MQLGYNGERIRHGEQLLLSDDSHSAQFPVNSGSASGWRRTIWHLLLTALVLKFIAGLTLHSATEYPSRNTFLCLWGCDSEELRDLISNILLFIPLGWVLRYWMGPRLAIILCLLATIGIETTQAFILTGRDPSLRDILTNAAGGVIGIWSYDHWRRVLHCNRRTSQRLAGIGFGIWGSILLLTALGLRPAGSSYPWFGHWGNHIEYYAPFDGEVKTVEINGWIPPAGPFPADNPVIEDLAQDSVDLHVVAVNGQVTGRVALIFAVMDEHGNQMLFVGGAWRSIQFQGRTRLARWGLRDLSMRLPLSPGSLAHDTLDITAQLRPDAWRLTLRSRGAVDSIAIPLTVGLGWATLLPAPLAMAYEWYVMNTLWVGILVLPAVYWWRRARPQRGGLESAAIIVGVLLLVPLLTGVAPSSRSDWIGGALGLLAGVMLARRSLQRHPVA